MSFASIKLSFNLLSTMIETELACTTRHGWLATCKQVLKSPGCLANAVSSLYGATVASENSRCRLPALDLRH